MPSSLSLHAPHIPVRSWHSEPQEKGDGTGTQLDWSRDSGVILLEDLLQSMRHGDGGHGQVRSGCCSPTSVLGHFSCVAALSASVGGRGWSPAKPRRVKSLVGSQITAIRLGILRM